MSIATDAQDAAFEAFADTEIFAAGTLSHTVRGAYSATAGTSLDVTRKASIQVYLDSSSIKTLGFKFGSDLVRAGDLLAVIPAKGLTFTPEEGDELVMAAGKFKVVRVAPSYVADTPIVFELMVRR